ncbi:MAG: hypothetical protein V4819_13575 [Verrucomicrobiota bacterium]
MKNVLALLVATVLPLSAVPLSGTKSIGPTGNYTSITAAVAAVQTQTLSGPLVLELQPSYLSSVETFPLVFSNLSTTAANTLTLRPQSGAAGLSISSADTTAATVNLSAAQFVTFDGRPGGTGTAKQLTIANTSTIGSAVRFINEASSNTLRYLVLHGVNTSATSGTVVFSSTGGANGNDNNTIDSCDIRDGASTPTNAIYSLGTTATAQNNSGNTISNCNVFNFYSPAAVDAAGVRLDGGNTDWSITGNSFYQTVSRAAVAANVRAIFINNTSGNNFSVTGNFIGGSGTNAGGTAWTTTGMTARYLFKGIQLNVGTTTASSVQGNTIRNITWSTSGTTNAVFSIWSGIAVSAGNANIGTVTGNTIGSSTGTDSITVITSGTLGSTFGIGSESSGPQASSSLAVANNTIGSITTNASLIGIQTVAQAVDIYNNTVGSTIMASSFNAITPAAATTQKVAGIISSAATSSITGNTVANLNHNYTGTSNAGQILGIVSDANVNTITSNTVRNLSTTSQNAGKGSSASLLGILAGSSIGSGSNNPSVSRNTVHSLSNTATSASVDVAGIYCTGNSLSAMTVIEGNTAHSLSIASTSASSQLYGMYFNRGIFTVQNNMVRVGIDASGASTAGASTVAGIYESVPAFEMRNFYHNSVFVGGTQTTGGSTTSAYACGDSYVPRVFRNNIFVNARSNGGATGKHYAVKANIFSALASANNIYFVSGSGGVIGSYNGIDCTTLAALQAATRQDGSSAVADPLFINPSGDATAVDLHLQPGNPAEGGGLPIAAVIDDFDGQTRSSLTPVDIGADAGNFTSTGDIFPPAISYPLLPPIGTTTNRTLTGWASIVDNSGTVASGVNAPRLYYKKSTDAEAFDTANDSSGNGWKYVTGTEGVSGSYSFTIDYALINGGSVSAGDSIQYFVVAQDAANNLGSSPPAATVSGNPPVENINGKPGAGVNRYSIAPSGGTVTVGPGGNFPDLTGVNGLFGVLNAVPLTSNLMVKLTGDVTEGGGTTLNANTADITIQPDSATMRTISGSGYSGLIRLNGVNHVTIDGSFGGSGRYLTFRNTNTGINAATITFTNDASNNCVRHCVIEGATTDGAGVVSFTEGVTTGNDNNTVTGNLIRDLSNAAVAPGTLVSSYGTSDAVANSNNTISNNEMFNFTYAGVYVRFGSESWNITDNTIYQTAPQTDSLIGISFNGLGTNMIRRNIVRDLTYSSGISIGNQSGSMTVDGNRLWNIGNATGNLGATGIYFAPAAGQSVTVVNNMVTLSSSGTPPLNFYGIGDGGTAGSTVVVAHNTVLLTGATTSVYASWAFIRQGGSNATVKNNLFLNLRTGGGNHFAANYSTASTGSLTMDSNVYAGTGLSNAANFLDAGTGQGGSTPGVPISFAQWQVNVPGDIHSSASTPGGNYTSAMFGDPANGDLHLVPTGNVLVNNTGTPVAGVTTDCDGDTRSLTTPDIGADELRPPFQQWAQANAVGDDPNSPGANGLANLLNFSFDLNPAAASRNELSYTGNVITPGGITTQTVSGTPTAKFIRRADYVAAGLTYNAQFSADLSNWETDNTTPTVLATDGVNEVAGLNYPLLSGGAKARFFRQVVGLQ